MLAGNVTPNAYPVDPINERDLDGREVKYGKFTYAKCIPWTGCRTKRRLQVALLGIDYRVLARRYGCTCTLVSGLHVCYGTSAGWFWQRGGTTTGDTFVTGQSLSDILDQPRLVRHEKEHVHQWRIYGVYWFPTPISAKVAISVPTTSNRRQGSPMAITGGASGPRFRTRLLLSILTLVGMPFAASCTPEQVGRVAISSENDSVLVHVAACDMSLDKVRIYNESKAEDAELVFEGSFPVVEPGETAIWTLPHKVSELGQEPEAKYSVGAFSGNQNSGISNRFSFTIADVMDAATSSRILIGGGGSPRAVKATEFRDTACKSTT